MKDMTIKRRNAKLRSLDLDKIRELLAYDPITGNFTWLVRDPGRTEVGQIAGWTIKGGYVLIGVCRTKVLAHVLA